METENWRLIIGFDSPRYEVSDRGRVRNFETKRIMAIEIQDSGHHRVHLSKNKKQRGRYVHRLVYVAFIGEIHEGLIVLHKDDDPSNNCPNNLELGTHKKNAIDRATRGRTGKFHKTSQAEIEANEWRPIEGYPDHQISDQGHVFNTKTGRLMTIQEKGTGHARVGLTRNGKQRKLLLHRLLYKAFNGDIPEGYVICHEDGKGHSNSPDNLRADTQKNNLADRLEHGTLRHAESHYKSFFSNEQIHEIRRSEENTCELARRLGCDRTTIRNIRLGKSWQHVITPGWEPKPRKPGRPKKNT